MPRATQLSPERYAELRSLIAAGASHEQAAQKMGISTGAVTWRLKKLGVKSQHLSNRPPAGQERDPRIPGGRRRPSKDDSEFSGQEVRYCDCLDRGVPQEKALAVSGLERNNLAGLYVRWMNRLCK